MTQVFSLQGKPKEEDHGCSVHADRCVFFSRSS